MKKIVLLLIVVLVIGGAAWGQGFPPAPPAVAAPVVADHAVGFLGAFNAVPTLSTEARYSAGIFRSMVDDYIDVNRYDPQIGTFVFAGGYPARGYDPGDPAAATPVPESGMGVSDTQYITGDQSAPDYAISFGLGKTFNSLYLGIYYGGSVVNAWGDKVASTERSVVNWSNKLAVLFGTQNYGAFRFDVILDTSTRTEGSITNKSSTAAPSIAVTWGGIKLAGMDPYIAVGYMFPDEYVWNPGTGKVTYTGISAFGVQGGLKKDLDSTSYISGDLAIGGLFGGKYSGAVSSEQKGAFGINAQLAYKKTLDFGQFSLGFQPAVGIAYSSDSRADISGDYKTNGGTTNIFELASGVDVGAKYQLNQKFAFYTGASMQFFDWRIASNSTTELNQWAFNGLMFSPSSFSITHYNTANPTPLPGVRPAPHGVLGFGTTFTPINNLVIGAGLNSFTNKLFAVNLTSMRIETNIQNTATPFLNQLFSNIVFDLTASYKF